MIELLSNEDEEDDNDDENDNDDDNDNRDHEQITNSKDPDESIASFYQKFSAQLQIDDSTTTTMTNHLGNQKYVHRTDFFLCLSYR